MMVVRERPAHVEGIRTVTNAAFADPARPDAVTPEAVLVDELRASEAWLPRLSLVVEQDDRVVGHVVCSRAHVGSVPVLGLGPLSVHPDHQRRGVGTALMHAVLAAADALEEPLVALLGHRAYYPRFGFRPAEEFGIAPQQLQWRDNFQVRTLSDYRDGPRGTFVYAEPFARV